MSLNDYYPNTFFIHSYTWFVIIFMQICQVIIYSEIRHAPFSGVAGGKLKAPWDPEQQHGVVGLKSRAEAWPRPKSQKGSGLSSEPCCTQSKVKYRIWPNSAKYTKYSVKCTYFGTLGSHCNRTEKWAQRGNTCNFRCFICDFETIQSIQLQSVVWIDRWAHRAAAAHAFKSAIRMFCRVAKQIHHQSPFFLFNYILND